MRNYKSAFFLISLVLLTLVNGLSAQNFEDDLFQEDTLVSEDAGTQDSGAADLLTSEKVILGGSFSMKTNINSDANLWDDKDFVDTVRLGLDLKSTLFVDARPLEDYRVFIKGELSYPFNSAQNFTLREVFADFNVKDNVYLRVGKQTVNWGVGYFFSPANLISLQAKDPEDPTKELLGPVAVKANLPWGLDNYYLYGIFEDMNMKNTAGAAPRGEWVIGDNEISLGGFYRPNEPWAVASTWSGKLGDFNLFGEGVLRGQEDKVFLVRNSLVTKFTPETRKSELFLQGTLGFTWSWSDEEGILGVNAMGQYYYNGLGYDDFNLSTADSQALGMLVATGVLPKGDIMERGRHYGAFSLGFSNILDSDLGLSLFLMGNLSDFSSKSTATVSWKGWEHLTLSSGYTLGYGADGAEFSPSGVSHSLNVSVTLGAGTF